MAPSIHDEVNELSLSKSAIEPSRLLKLVSIALSRVFNLLSITAFVYTSLKLVSISPSRVVNLLSMIAFV